MNTTLTSAKIETVHEIANYLIDKLSPGWRFRFNARRKRSLGACCHVTCTIELNTEYSERAPISQIVNTILHEIAHARVGAGHGHGLRWKQEARSLGCNAKRLSKVDYQASGKYTLYCPKCAECKGVKHRLDQKIKSGRAWFTCLKCGGRCDIIQNF